MTVKMKGVFTAQGKHNTSLAASAKLPGELSQNTSTGCHWEKENAIEWVFVPGPPPDLAELVPE
jgi:hypothetical protein